jgi:superfamily I DNA and RNA helicase
MIRIQATAGSGKTQLALRLLETAVTDGQNALYVCFNRSLADHMARIAPSKSNIVNYHDLCVDYFRRKHGDPDFSDPGIFQKVVDIYQEDSESFSGKYDLLVIDEGQDFEPGWVETLLPQLKDEGRLYLMEDPDQRLYERAGFDLPDAVSVSCYDNFRSPRAICQAIDAFALASSPIQSRSFFVGDMPEFHRYASENDVVECTAGAIEKLLLRGFAIEDIVVLTGRGVKKSVVLKADQIGRHKTRRFAGTYSARTGLPDWTDGELLVESVYRYKGQAAPAVILTEVDFPELTAMERRKLFVGMTRALMSVDIVLSGQAEACFSALLSG